MRANIATIGLAVALSAAAGLAAQGTESGAFVVRLGRDTLAVEQFTRSATAIDGQQVVRVGQTVHRVYHADLAPDGSLRRFEVAIHRVTQPGAKELRASIEVSGDSATVRAPRQDSMVVTRLAVAHHAVPWLSHSYALVEHVGRLARAAGGERFTSQAIRMGDDPLPVTITRGAADTLVILIDDIGPLRVRLDRAGRLLGGTGLGSTAQVDVERVAPLDMNALGKSFAARPLGTLSPPDSVRVTIAGATLGVKYGRPAMRGRVIFGVVVPWGKVWRTGANEATVLTTSAGLDALGTTIPAGAYSLWTVPTPGGWTLIINRNTGQWGTDYDSAHDFARLPMRVEQLAQPVERFTIAIEPKDAGAVLKLEWETTRAWIPFTPK